MPSRYEPVAVKVWGEMACFTRPEMKVERVTYPAMTPSAARGVLEAIFWKPEFQWRIREIAVLNDIQYCSLVRNEVSARANVDSAQRRINGEEGMYSDDPSNRTQRNSLCLKDVAYVIRADVEVRTDVAEDAAKFRDQFRRRVASGRCFHRPYLGCREFAAYFANPSPGDRSVERTEGLGLMLFDLEYRGPTAPARPLFFAARLDRGVLRVPPEMYGGSAHAA